MAQAYVRIIILTSHLTSHILKPECEDDLVKTLRAEQIFLSAVTIGELQAGGELTRRNDTAKALEIEAWLTMVEASFAALPMDSACFREWARLMVG